MLKMAKHHPEKKEKKDGKKRRGRGRGTIRITMIMIKKHDELTNRKQKVKAKTYRIKK